MAEASRFRGYISRLETGEVTAAGYVALIITAEVTTIFLSPRFGVFSHLIVLAGLMVHSALTRSDRLRRLLLPLALGPLTRVLSLAMPLNVLQPIWGYLLIYFPLFAASLVVMRNLDMGRRQAGLVVGSLPPQLAVAATGLGLGVIEYFILRPYPLAERLGADIALPALILIATTGFVEELVFRGIMQHFLWREVGRRGILYVAIIFSTLHVGYLSAADVIFVFGVSLFLAYIRQRTGSLLGISLSHGITNVVLYLVAPFLW